jgi:HEPN domain-containing protein
MSPDPVRPGSPEDWLAHARSDLALSEMKRTRTVLYEHLCFHAQQAAEKAIKAVLVSKRVRFPKAHDLAFLIDLLPADATLPPALIDLPVLTRYAVLQRYPGEHPPVTFVHRRRAVQLAEEAVIWASHCVATQRHAS